MLLYELENLAKVLEENGFKMEWRSDELVRLSNDLINVTVTIATGEAYSIETYGGFYAEHRDCFDKLGNMPVRIEKEEIVDYNELIKLLRWLGTEEGIHIDYCHSFDEWRDLAKKSK